MGKKKHSDDIKYILPRNPLENKPDYRSSILTMLPYLRSLDFAKVTDRERKKPLESRNRRKKKHSL